MLAVVNTVNVNGAKNLFLEKFFYVCLQFTFTAERMVKMKNNNVVEKLMEAETVFVENGIEYYEKDGLYYPKLVLGDELVSNIYVGRWGREWMRYLESVDKVRYRRLLISGELKTIARDVDEEAGEMIERLEKEYYEKHRHCCNGFWKTYQVREQGRVMAEEIVRSEIIHKVR